MEHKKALLAFRSTKIRGPYVSRGDSSKTLRPIAKEFEVIKLTSKETDNKKMTSQMKGRNRWVFAKFIVWIHGIDATSRSDRQRAEYTWSGAVTRHTCIIEKHGCK